MSSEVRSAPRVRDGVRVALPLVPGPIVFGISFGVLAEAAGFGAAAAVVMSATMFAGSAQFAAVSAAALAVAIVLVLTPLTPAGVPLVAAASASSRPGPCSSAVARCPRGSSRWSSSLRP